MKKLVLLIILILNFFLVSKAQLYNFTKTIGSIGGEGGHFVTVDESTGNVYVLGNFQHTIDVDFGPAVYNLTSDSAYGFFIAKYTDNGNLIWARKAEGSINCSGAQVASNGDLIFGGTYWQNAGFYASTGYLLLPYANYGNPYIARFTSNGNLTYVKNFGGYSNTDYDMIGFKLDHLDNIIFSINNVINNSEIDLDPGPNLVYCDKDYALVKYDQNGNYIWSKLFGEWPAYIWFGDLGQNLDVDMYNNIYIGGQFNGTIDFSSGGGTGILAGTSAQQFVHFEHFLCKFDSFGNLIFAKKTTEEINNGTPNWTGQGGEYWGQRIRVNELGSEILISFTANDTFNINPGGSIIEFLPGNGSDICLLKYDGSGNLIWHKQIISSHGDENISQIELDLSGNIYLTGDYTGDIYFNPATPVVNIPSLTSFGFFLVKLDTNGNYIWEWKANNGFGNSIYLDDCENLYGVGNFMNQVNFSPPPDLDIKNSTGGADAYFLKYSKYRIDLLSQTNPTGCGLLDGSFTLSGLNPNATYNIYTKRNGSSFTVSNLTSDSNGVVHITGLASGLYTQIYTIINGCKFYCNQDVNLISPAFDATLSNQSQPTFCTATDGSISFVGFNPNVQYVVNYYFNATNFITQNVFSNSNGSLLLNNLALGTYSNFQFSALGCSSAVFDTIVLVTTNIGNNITLASNNPTNCIAADGTITINGLLPNANYLISYDYNGLQISVSLIANSNGMIIVNALDTGSYTNIQIGITGCSFTTINNFEIVNPPAPSAPTIGNHVSFCSNNISAITAPVAAGGIINWYSDVALTSLINTGSSYSPSAFVGQQTFYITETINGCESIPAPILVTINEQPTVSFAGDSITTCLTQINLAANVPQVGLGNWSIISGTAVVTNEADPTSLVNLSDGVNILSWSISNGVCPVSTSQVRVNVVPMQLSATILSNDICDKGNGKVALSQIGGIAPVNYAWPNLSDSGSVQTNLSSGIYSVTATDSQGCVSSFSFVLPTENTALVDAGVDRLINAGDSVFFNLQQQGTYLWTPDSTLTCSACPNPIAFPKTTTTYQIEFMDTNGCFATDEIKIEVDVLCAELFIPTGFSPNGDGINDLECVHGDCFKYMVFVIYNRWGEKVFETTDSNLCWDGLYKGNMCNEGVYTYYLNATTIKNEFYSKKGNVTLIK